MPRIDRLISRNLGLSRRQATRLFRSGRVRGADEVVLRDPAGQVKPSELPRIVLIDGQRHTLYSRYHLLQHKPVGVVTALRDSRHPTVRELIDDAPLADDLRPIGRLDRDVSGLLLWTTEGSLLHRLTHPRYGVPRVYQAALSGPYSPLPSDRPLLLEDGYAPAIHSLTSLREADLHPGLAVPSETRELATITVASGQFHEVKRIFEALGCEVIGLCRVAYGPVMLPIDLPPGESRAIDLLEIFADLHPAPKKASTGPTRPLTSE